MYKIRNTPGDRLIIKKKKSKRIAYYISHSEMYSIIKNNNTIKK